MKARFVTDCVSSTARDISPMVEAERDITRRTFCRHVDRAERESIERMRKVWDVYFGSCRFRFYTHYHAEQFQRALDLNGTANRLVVSNAG